MDHGVNGRANNSSREEVVDVKWHHWHVRYMLLPAYQNFFFYFLNIYFIVLDYNQDYIIKYYYFFIKKNLPVTFLKISKSTFLRKI